ncbi:MAG: hypothetical protein ACJAST_003034 [Halopseudomonas sp.]|jgi:hypothetical protein
MGVKEFSTLKGQIAASLIDSLVSRHPASFALRPW